MSASITFQRKEAIEQKAYAANKPTNLVEPRTFVNSTTLGRLVGVKMVSNREGSDQHLDHASVGILAQLKRVGV